MINSPVVSAQWLHSNFSNNNLVILDASPEKNVSGLVPEFPGQVIPGARCFDLEKDFSRTDTNLPHMLQSVEDFQNAARALGINESSEIVVYDNLGVYTSARAWWMFRAMGHQNIAVLDGGLTAWVRSGFTTVTSHDKNFTTGNFVGHLKNEMVRDAEFVSHNIATGKCLVMDARSEGRFKGTAPEPRQGVRSGRIPNSTNLPFQDVLSNGFMKPKEELKKIFDPLIQQDSPIVFSCGSGLTACIILLAAELVNNNPKSVYDGSWAEWGASNFPIENG